jgi:hypothetical protein
VLVDVGVDGEHWQPDCGKAPSEQRRERGLAAAALADERDLHDASARNGCERFEHAERYGVLFMGGVLILVLNKSTPTALVLGGEVAARREGQYAIPTACLTVAGSSSISSIAWATSARETE